MRVLIGWDDREAKAYEVAAKSAQEHGFEVTPLYEQRLRYAGLLTRPVDKRPSISRSAAGWDIYSNAPQSTDFAVSRFFVPLLAHSGWVLFTDCDVLFMQDATALERHLDRSKAVMVVKHCHRPKEAVKMDDQPQTTYPRKNWSSVVAWNCDHAANKRLNLTTLNQWPGRDLHAFGWLNDHEIGELPREWNWLVGVQDKPELPAIAHYTLGGPWLPHWEPREHDELWLAAQQRYRS